MHTKFFALMTCGNITNGWALYAALAIGAETEMARGWIVVADSATGGIEGNARLIIG